MDDEMTLSIMCMCALVMCIVIMVAAYYLIKHKNVFGDGLFKSKGTSGPGKPLGPLRSLAKNVPPWNVISVSNDANVSVDNAGRVRIKFSAGKWGLSSGGAFHANPFRSLPATSCVLSYKIFFPPGFDWKKGGKLPGVCLGKNAKDCASGGDWSTTGGSARLMFSEGGSVIGYLYMPFGSSNKTLAKQSSSVRSRLYPTGGSGLNVWSKPSPFKLRANAWNAISVRVSLNTPGAANGSFGATVNGVSRELTGIRWRDAASTNISSANIVSFFGGGSREWAAPSSSPYVLIDDVRFSAS